MEETEKGIGTMKIKTIANSLYTYRAVRAGSFGAIALIVTAIFTGDAALSVVAAFFATRVADSAVVVFDWTTGQDRSVSAYR